MDGEVTDPQVFLGHAQRNTADIFDEAHDEGGPDDVPADDEESTDNLEANLPTVSCDGAAGVGNAKGCAALLGSPET